MAKTERLFFAVMLLAVGMWLGGCGQMPHMVHISTDPSGAMVFFNDKVIGETPMDTVIQQRRGDRHTER